MRQVSVDQVGSKDSDGALEAIEKDVAFVSVAQVGSKDSDSESTPNSTGIS